MLGMWKVIYVSFKKYVVVCFLNFGLEACILMYFSYFSEWKLFHIQSSSGRESGISCINIKNQINFIITIGVIIITIRTYT